MILDTTYLLPLVRIAIDRDLLLAIATVKANIKFDEISISLISIFELQAKAAKLEILAKFTIKAIETILKAFRVEPFYNPRIIETSYELKRIIPDYIDCVIVATAIVLKEDLITEDSLILSKKEIITKKYNIEIMSFKEIVK